MLTQQAVLLRGEWALWRIWFFEKKFLIYFWIRVRTRCKLSLVFRLSPVCSKLKFMFFTDIHLFGLKTTSHGKSDLENDFLGQVYHVKWFSGQKVEYPRITWTWTCCKLGWAWKPGWACTWPWPWQNTKFQIFFSKNQPCHIACSARERTACCINTCPRKGVYQKRQ